MSNLRVQFVYNKREKRDIFLDLGYIKYITELYMAYKYLMLKYIEHE